MHKPGSILRTRHFAPFCLIFRFKFPFVLFVADSYFQQSNRFSNVATFLDGLPSIYKLLSVYQRICIPSQYAQILEQLSLFFYHPAKEKWNNCHTINTLLESYAHEKPRSEPTSHRPMVADES